MSRCTTAKDVAELEQPSPHNVPVAWLARALTLDPALICSVSVVPFNAGGSPFQKCRIHIDYADGLDDGKDKNRPTTLFGKFLPRGKEWEKLSLFIRTAVVQAQTVEASLYLTLESHASLNGIAPRAYHASDSMILLEDAGSISSTCTALSAWSPTDPSGPNIDKEILKKVFESLSVLHFTHLETETLLGILTFDALATSRGGRINDATKESGNLATSLNSMSTHFCADNTKLVDLCNKVATIGWEKIFRSITPKAPQLVHGDPNPGNILFDSASKKAYLIDFQDASFGGSAVVDISRVLLSSITPKSRREVEDELSQYYFSLAEKAHYPIGSFAEYKESLQLALLADASFIMASLTFVLAIPAPPPLYYELAERSTHYLGDHAAELIALLEKKFS